MAVKASQIYCQKAERRLWEGSIARSSTPSAQRPDPYNFPRPSWQKECLPALNWKGSADLRLARGFSGFINDRNNFFLRVFSAKRTQRKTWHSSPAVLFSFIWLSWKLGPREKNSYRLLEMVQKTLPHEALLAFFLSGFFSWLLSRWG
jgi:hypothetical protein